MNSKCKSSLLAMTVALLLVAAASTWGATWDPIAEWSITNGNPNGAWTYGWFNQLGGTFSTNMTAEDRGGGVQVWVGPAPSDAGLIKINADGYLHPGSNGAMPSFRWTAPSAMHVDLQCLYMGKAPEGTTTDVHVLLNGVSLFDGMVNGFAGTPPDYLDAKGTSPQQPFGAIVSVNAGDTIDLCIGYGNGTYTSDLTGIVATLNTVTDFGTLQGTVKDSFNVPVANAVVSVDGLYYSAKTRADGSYTMLLPPGTYGFTASKAGYESGTSGATITIGGTATSNFVLGNAIIKGTVRSNLTGNPPLVGATVRATDSWGVAFTATTSEGGAYSLSVAPDNFFIEVIFPGYIQQNDYVSVLAGENVTKDYTLELIPGDSWDAAADFGPSTNPNNVWSYGYLLALDGPLTLYPDYFSTSTLAGWVLDNSPDSQGSVMLNASDIPVDANPYYWEAWQLTPHPGPGGRMATVRWTAPLAMYVKVASVFTGQMMDQTTTDVHVTKNGVALFDGTVSGFAGTAANGYTDAVGTSPKQAFNAVIHVDAGETIDFVVGPGPNANNLHDLTGLTAVVSALTQRGTLVGTVTAAGGAPVAGATISVLEEPYSTVTGADGSYTLELPAGIWTVKASHPVCSELSQTAVITEGNTTTCDFELTVTKRQITGTVTIVSGSSTEPIAGATVSVPSLDLTTQTDSSGLYSLVLPVGTYSVIASHPKAAAPVTVDVTIEANLTPLTQDFALTDRGRVTFYVKPDGDDEADGRTEATAWATIDNGDARNFLLPGDTVIVKPGVYNNVRVIRPDGMTGAVFLTRAGTAELPITYKAEPGAIVEGQGGQIAFQTWTGCDYTIIDGFEIRNAPWGMNMEDYGVGGGTNITVKNCVFHDCSVEAIQVVYVQNVTLVRNTFYNIANACVRVHVGGRGLSIYNCVGADCAIGLMLHGSAATGVNVRNSIFLNNSQVALLDQSGSGSTNVTSDYNVFYNCVADFSGVSQGANDWVGIDPMFAGAAAHNYALASGSPCIDAGIVITGVDYSGTAPDRGAVETVGAVTVANLREARDLDAGTAVQIDVPQVATAASGTFTDGRYYLEDADRTAGMMVIPASGLPAVALGSRVTLTGTIAVDGNGEKYIAATAATSVPGTALTTLGVTNKAFGDCPGMLVRVWGKVTEKTPDYLTIDDGSLIPIRVVLSGLAASIDTSNITAGTSTISVSGLAGAASGGVPAVRPRAQSDIKVY